MCLHLCILCKILSAFFGGNPMVRYIHNSSPLDHPVHTHSNSVKLYLYSVLYLTIVILFCTLPPNLLNGLLYCSFVAKVLCGLLSSTRWFSVLWYYVTVFIMRWEKENNGVNGRKHSWNLPGRNFLGRIVLMCFVVPWYLLNFCRIFG
jgi:hypothetical protein